MHFTLTIEVREEGNRVVGYWSGHELLSVSSLVIGNEDVKEAFNVLAVKALHEVTKKAGMDLQLHSITEVDPSTRKGN